MIHAPRCSNPVPDWVAGEADDWLVSLVWRLALAGEDDVWRVAHAVGACVLLAHDDRRPLERLRATLSGTEPRLERLAREWADDLGPAVAKDLARRMLAESRQFEETLDAVISDYHPAAWRALASWRQALECRIWVLRSHYPADSIVFQPVVACDARARKHLDAALAVTPELQVPDEGLARTAQRAPDEWWGWLAK